MKCIVVILAVVSAACGASLPAELIHTAYGYLERFGVPQWEQMMAAANQEPSSRIVGGSPASLGQFPFQAGLLLDITGLQGNGVCGGSLISANRVLTAAHCWFDGQNQAWRVTVRLGSINIFSGGHTQQSTNVIMHNNWFPLLARNDVAVIRLNSNVPLSNSISIVALPSGNQLNEDFVGLSATASGFGRTSEGGLFTNQVLNHISLPVVTNAVCRAPYPLPIVVHDTNICTAGTGGRGTCQGDSGGPLTIQRNGAPLLIGVTSFGHPSGCESGNPAAYARVTSFNTWIRGQI